MDTNIFLEILLRQSKSSDCKNFLNDNIGNLAITDFSLHSIGVILFRYNKENAFKTFLRDIFPGIELISLPAHLYEDVIINKQEHSLDFDDAYQHAVSQCFGYTLATMDQDFKRIEKGDIHFL